MATARTPEGPRGRLVHLSYNMGIYKLPWTHICTDNGKEFEYIFPLHTHTKRAEYFFHSAL